MPGGDNRNINIFLPSELVSPGEPQVLQFAILDDVKIAGDKRAIVRTYRDANASDAGRIRRVQWEIWGPIGASLESTAGRLSTDFCRNLETRWERRLISAGQQTEVELDGLDPSATASVFGTAIFGSSTFYKGPGSLPGQDVVVFDEQDGYLFAHRGNLSTQIRLDNFDLVQTVDHNYPVVDAALWRTKGRIAFGEYIPMQTRDYVDSTGSTYIDTVAIAPAQDVYAQAVKRGSDRAWYIDADTSGTTYNYAGYTLDAFETLAAPFQVGDPDVNTTGIGPFGPFTMFGAEDNLYSFTDQGKPVPLSRALLNHLTDHNGQQWADPGWGWNYAITSIGLRAIQPGVDNPVGIGERMRGFTGHDGIPHAIWAERGELWCVYRTTNGELYAYRGAFGPETANTGQPLWFPWFYESSATCGALFSSVRGLADPLKNYHVFSGNGTNMRYMLGASDGRDDLCDNYLYSIEGGNWYGTTLDREPNLLKTLRLARFKTRNITDGSYWQLGMAFNPSPDFGADANYIDIGTAVTSNGGHTIEPVQGNVPISNISGFTMKPRLTQVASGTGASSTPPEVYGNLEIEYDERPEQIEEITVVINMTGTAYSNNLIWDKLRELVGSNTYGPIKIQLPDDQPPIVSRNSSGGQKWAMLSAVTSRDDVKDPGIEGVQLTFQVWPQGDTI
jgi:hypothetical protein